jgi:nitrite reductase/ring-hydroxylating ferredoxin subunit/Fe-S cluster biogenesis protein NfuA
MTGEGRVCVTADLPDARDDLTGLLGDIEHLEEIFGSWDQTQRGAVDAYRRSIEALYGEAIRRLVRSLKSAPAALAAMKSAVADEVVYAVLRRQGIIKPSVNERVEAALAGVRPMLATHGGDVELVSVEPPTVSVRFLGSCDGCPASSLTFHEGVEKAVKDACPEITTITQTKSGLEGPRSGAPDNPGGAALVSPFDLNRGGIWRRAGDVTQVPEGGVRAFDVGGQSVLLARIGTALTCFDNACAHLGMPIDQGHVERGILTCPHHGFAYDLSSGECITAPSVQLTARAVRVIGDRVEVRVSR